MSWSWLVYVSLGLGFIIGMFLVLGAMEHPSLYQRQQLLGTIILVASMALITLVWWLT